MSRRGVRDEQDLKPQFPRRSCSEGYITFQFHSSDLIPSHPPPTSAPTDCRQPPGTGHRVEPVSRLSKISDARYAGRCLLYGVAGGRRDIGGIGQLGPVTVDTPYRPTGPYGVWRINT
ncbi:unnamed protein product [Calypogeia fissa]